MAIYGLNDVGQPIKLLQRALNEKLKLKLTCDGHLGKITQSALGNYQLSQGIDERDSDGICYGDKTQEALKSFIEKRYLKESDYVEAASSLGLDVASVKTITTVEAKEFGFLPDGFPVVLFERHKFYQFLVKNKGATFANTMATSYPAVCNPEAGGYVGGSDEVKRLTIASTIDQTSALLSTSYGLFQIMGFNYKACGFENVRDFADAMKNSERDQLMAFVCFIKNDNALLEAIKAKDWKTVAKRYNGPAYAKNQYDVKLVIAYESFHRTRALSATP